MIRKNSQQIGNKGMYLNIVKAIYDKPTVNIIIIDEKLKVVPLIAGAKQRSPLLFFLGGGGRVPCGLWDFSSLTRDQTQALSIKSMEF